MSGMYPPIRAFFRRNHRFAKTITTSENRSETGTCDKTRTCEFYSVNKEGNILDDYNTV